jgi:hypothetical protein
MTAPNFYVALAAGFLDRLRRVIPARTHPMSPSRYTQPQLLACVCLGIHLNLSYRRLEDWLAASESVCRVLGLPRVPDHNTLCRAARWMLRPDVLPRVRAVLAASANPSSDSTFETVSNLAEEPLRQPPFSVSYPSLTASGENFLPVSNLASADPNPAPSQPGAAETSPPSRLQTKEDMMETLRAELQAILAQLPQTRQDADYRALIGGIRAILTAANAVSSSQFHALPDRAAAEETYRGLRSLFETKARYIAFSYLFRAGHLQGQDYAAAWDNLFPEERAIFDQEVDQMIA